MADDSKSSIEGKVSVEFNPNKENLENLTGAKELENGTNSNLPRQTPSLPNDSSVVGNPVDKKSAIGYNQGNVPKTNNPNNDYSHHSGLASKPGLDDRDESLRKDSQQTLNEPRESRREQAPDIDKDYGEGLPRGNNSSSTNPGEDSLENSTSSSNNPSDLLTQNPNPEKSNGDSLEKNNDLVDKTNEENKNALDNDNENNQDEKEQNDLTDKSALENGNENNQDEQEQDDLTDKNKNDDSDLNPEAPNPKKNVEGTNDENNKQVRRNSPSTSDDNQSQVGNGYGALKNRPSTNSSNGTENARKNLEHSNRMNSGNDEEESKTKNAAQEKNESESENTNNNPRSRNPFRSFLNGKNKQSVSNGDGKEDERKDNSFLSNMGFNSGTIIKFLLNNPIVLCGIIVGIFLIFLLLLGLDGEFNNGGNGVCTYELNGILDSGPVTLEGVQVELVNCDAKSDNYTVLETVDFEKYVIGVTVSEVGYESVYNPELYKAQIVAARNYALLRNRAMCPSNPDDCFYGYNPNTGKIRMRACTNEQVYCDIDKDCYRKTRGDEPALVGPEVNEGDEGAYVWKAKPSEELKEQLISVANEVKGVVLVDSSNQVVYTGFEDDDQQAWRAMANEGMKYDEILSTHFNVDGGHIYQANCTSGNIGNIDYGDYSLNSDGDAILHEPLETFLQKNGSSLEEFNALIAKNVEKAGYGTRAGTVAAAVTLIGELGDQFNVKVPYYWGGGHGDGIATGAKGNWGSTACHTYANNRSYDYCGLDCSGFVPWAINNGGFNVRQNLAGNFKNLSGARRVSLGNSAVLQPGDLLESNHHVVLVIGIDESSNNYICAEASGAAYGVLFTRRPFNLSGYWGVDMTGYYEANAKSK